MGSCVSKAGHSGSNDTRLSERRLRNVDEQCVQMYFMNRENHTQGGKIDYKGLSKLQRQGCRSHSQREIRGLFRNADRQDNTIAVESLEAGLAQAAQQQLEFQDQISKHHRQARATHAYFTSDDYVWELRRARAKRNDQLGREDASSVVDASRRQIIQEYIFS